MAAEVTGTREAYFRPPCREPLVDEILGDGAHNHTFMREAFDAFSALPLQDGSFRMSMICGPTNAVYARLLASETGIPFTADDTVAERLELSIGYYDPGQDSALISDHTFIKYHTGDGTIGFIDVLYPHLWGTASVQLDRVQERIHYRLYPAADFNRRLAEEFHLYAFGEHTPQEIRRHPFVDADLANPHLHADVIHAINQPDIADLPPYVWREAAAGMLDKWLAGEGLHAVRYGMGSFYSRPRVPPSGFPAVPSLVSYMNMQTQALSRQRYNMSQNETRTG